MDHLIQDSVTLNRSGSAEARIPARPAYTAAGPGKAGVFYGAESAPVDEGASVQISVSGDRAASEARMNFRLLFSSYRF